jgi:hypothetical protein
VTDETPQASTEAADDAAPATSTQPKPRAAKRTTTKKAARSLEPTDVEFRFKGDPERVMSGIPATDLTQADVDRMTYRRTIPEPGADGLRRGESGFSEARAKVVREILATGHFTKRS